MNYEYTNIKVLLQMFVGKVSSVMWRWRAPRARVRLRYVQTLQISSWDVGSKDHALPVLGNQALVRVALGPPPPQHTHLFYPFGSH